ncbi:MAG TPA: LIC12192 family sporadic carbohydrate cluster protein [Candidatus Sulfotelmatobacter sp.]|nr:LIC12192 family sporadic carbohydrate cluster protein [Candidatus Sulfotelmatobacter sp.]
MSNRFGYRGYISSRPVRGLAQPQHVQNLVVRDYAQRAKLPYLLSATEYAMPGCYMVLESVLNELAHVEGVICYSLFMLPQKRARRRQVYERIFAAGGSLHGALEGMAVRSPEDVAMLEDIFMVDRFAVTALPAGLNA